MCRCTSLFGIFVFILGTACAAMAQPPAGLENPLVHGAWVYKVNCLRCHGPYARERPGEEYRTQASLEEAVAENGCRISWSKNFGGTLGVTEIEAVCHYIRTWEGLGREPDLPVLPDLPKALAETLPEQPPSEENIQPGEQQPALSPPLAKLVAAHPVAKGGWLYTRNCYRCHLAYGQTRQGRGMSDENLRKIVENGKTSTQMSGFAVAAGGKLVDSEIEAIVAYIVAWENFGGPPAIAPQLLAPPAGNPDDLRPLGLPQFPRVEGDGEKGRLVYRSHCSRCHNPDRSGFIGPGLRGPWQGFRPDLFLKAAVKGGVRGTLMPAFTGTAKGKLSPREIDEVVVFLLSPDA